MGMCGGGSPGDVTQNASSLPEYAEPYYKDLLARIGYETAQPYTPYPAGRLVPFNQAEQEAMSRFTEMGQARTPEDMRNAAATSTQISMGNPYADTMMQGTQRAQAELMSGKGAQAGGYYNPDQYFFDTLDDTAMYDRYMSPYQQHVTDINKREAMRDSAIMGNEIGLEAAGQGSLGGYREAIMQSERQRNLGQNLSDIQNKGQQDAYMAAQRAFEADRDMGFQSHMGYDQGKQFKAGLGLQGGEMDYQAASQAAGLGQSAYQNLLSGDQTRLQAAGDLTDYSAQQQQMEIERLMNMQAAGQIQRDLSQQGLDIGYQDFLRQQAYPKAQTSYYSSILQGLPIDPNATRTIYGESPSEVQQALGTGIAGVGLYRSFAQ